MLSDEDKASQLVLQPWVICSILFYHTTDEQQATNYQTANYQENPLMMIIEAGKLNKLYLKDLWLYRELFFFLAWRDILVRYKQTLIGITWSILRPVLTMVIFTIVFGQLAKMPAEGVPYPILVYAAMLPWHFFSSTLSEGGNSLVNNSAMISKVYFPRIIIPSTSMIVGLVDFIISFIILLLLMICYAHPPSLKLLSIPLFMSLAILVSLGVTFIISALNVKYRDFRYVLPFILQLGLYISPVGFSSTIIPDGWRLLYSINPMVGVIDGFRWAILDNTSLYLPGFCLSITVACGLFLFGFKFFRNMERQFADVI